MGAELIRTISPAPRDVWLEVLESDPTAFVYQTPAGLDAICAQRDCEDASRLYEFSDGRRLILPLFRRKGRPGWLTVERSPLIGSLVAPGPLRAEELVAIFSDLASRPVLSTTIRPTALSSDVWASAELPGAASQRRVVHILDLEGGFDEVWETRFHGQARRAVRKALKSGVEVECDRTGRLVPVFYDLLKKSIDRWAEQSHEPLSLARWRARRRDPMRGLQAIADTLGDACRIWLARVGGQPAAAIMVLQGANAHYTRGAMDKDLAGPSRASFLLQKLAIEDACNAGCRYYHMGETGPSGGLARFKSQFGAAAYTFSEYRLERLPISAIERRMRNLAKKILAFRRGAAEGS